MTIVILLVMLVVPLGLAKADEFSCPSGFSKMSGEVPHPWFDNVPIPSKWCVDKAGIRNGPLWGWDPETKTIVFQASNTEGLPDEIYRMYYTDGSLAEEGRLNYQPGYFPGSLHHHKTTRGHQGSDKAGPRSGQKPARAIQRACPVRRRCRSGSAGASRVDSGGCEAGRHILWEHIRGTNAGKVMPLNLLGQTDLPESGQSAVRKSLQPDHSPLPRPGNNQLAVNFTSIS
jgi:hypothetical protein